jgi:hypothetical protein
MRFCGILSSFYEKPFAVIVRFIYFLAGTITMSAILFLTLVVLALGSLAGGIVCLVKYAKTKEKTFLILGILFTFVIPALLLFFAFKTQVMVGYGPAPMMDYGPLPPPQ